MTPLQVHGKMSPSCMDRDGDDQKSPSPANTTTSNVMEASRAPTSNSSNNNSINQNRNSITNLSQNDPLMSSAANQWTAGAQTTAAINSMAAAAAAAAGLPLHPAALSTPLTLSLTDRLSGVGTGAQLPTQYQQSMPSTANRYHPTTHPVQSSWPTNPSAMPHSAMTGNVQQHSATSTAAAAAMMPTPFAQMAPPPNLHEWYFYNSSMPTPPNSDGQSPKIVQSAF